MSKELGIGIDLGTTNSAIAFAMEKTNGDISVKIVDTARPVQMFNSIDGQIRPSTERRSILPSCVYYMPERNYQPLVGDFAKSQYAVRPHLVAKSIKSQMGKQFAEGLSEDIPDKKPSEVSSRILMHLKKEAEKVLKTDINDIVITVPANFDSAMCKATRDAAQLAGIRVTNPDGSERPILLSEPNAVIYDIFNQIRNCEIPDTVLDLSKDQTVMVFDMGGGTLDITVHAVSKRADDNCLKVKEIATNRYTLLGGDDFDRTLAEAMYERYLAQNKAMQNNIAPKKDEVMSELLIKAEDLKIRFNDAHYSDDDGWFGEEENDFTVSGPIHCTGIAYMDTFTKEELEAIFSGYMGNSIAFDDYKNIENVTSTRNIIYPVLDVLAKASQVLSSNFKIDAVILNGGMSKFYMIKDRLTQFFGFSPIESVDPDQSVARGAAVYHYLLTHSTEDLTDDMRTIGDVPSDTNTLRTNSDNTHVAFKKSSRHIGIEMDNGILNDALYLGMRNGAVEELIPTGARLPYSSEEMKGFRIEPGQCEIAFPIKSRNLDGTYRTIAKSTLKLKNTSSCPLCISFKIDMDINKIITMRAWSYFANNEENKHDIGTATITIDDGFASSKKNPGKCAPPSGSVLDARAEISSLVRLAQNFNPSARNAQSISNRLRMEVSTICSAANRADFAPVVIKELQTNRCWEARTRLFIIARRIISGWSDEYKKALAKECMSQIAGALHGVIIKGAQKNTNIQAIYTLAFCGNESQISRLEYFHNDLNGGYEFACMYAHAVSKTNIDWLYEKFMRDAKAYEHGCTNHLETTAYLLGLALNKNSESNLSTKQIEEVIKSLVHLIGSSQLTKEQLTSCTLALGWICDKSNSFHDDIDSAVVYDAYILLDDVLYLYITNIIKNVGKSLNVAKKLMEGTELSAEDEKFLLEKITI